MGLGVRDDRTEKAAKFQVVLPGTIQGLWTWIRADSFTTLGETLAREKALALGPQTWESRVCWGQGSGMAGIQVSSLWPSHPDLSLWAQQRYPQTQDNIQKEVSPSACLVVHQEAEQT